MLATVEKQLSADDLALFKSRKRSHEMVEGDPIYSSWYELKVGHDKLLKETEEEHFRNCFEHNNKPEAMKTLIRYHTFPSIYTQINLNVVIKLNYKYYENLLFLQRIRNLFKTTNVNFVFS